MVGAAHPPSQPSIASIIHELRVSGDPTEEAWAEVIDALTAQVGRVEEREKHWARHHADAMSEVVRLGNASFDLKARIEALEAALRLARARIEYLGPICPNPSHHAANHNEFLPRIDAALSQSPTVARTPTNQKD